MTREGVGYMARYRVIQTADGTERLLRRAPKGDSLDQLPCAIEHPDAAMTRSHARKAARGRAEAIAVRRVTPNRGGQGSPVPQEIASMGCTCQKNAPFGAFMLCA
jgi:hypothetical protein